MKIIMRLYRRENGIWYFEINRGEGIQRRSLHTRDKALARKAFAEIKRDYLAGRVAEITGKCVVTLGQFRNEYLTWAERVQGVKTYEANALALRKLIGVAGETILLDRISPKHIDELVATHLARGLSVASVNHYIRHCRAVLGKAVEWQYLRANPLARVRQLPQDRRPPHILNRQEAVRFLASIQDVDLRRYVLALLATGRRRNELLGLEWKDIDLQGGHYFVSKSKNHLSRWYPINSMFRAVLVAIGPTEGRVFSRWQRPDTWSHKVKDALRQVGRGDMRQHDLRHTYASLQVMSGRTLKTVQELLGHVNISTTQIYAHLPDDHLAKAAEINLGPVDLGNSKEQGEK